MQQAFDGYLGIEELLAEKHNLLIKSSIFLAKRQNHCQTLVREGHIEMNLKAVLPMFYMITDGT